MDIAVIIIIAIICLVVGFVLGNIFPIFSDDDEEHVVGGPQEDEKPEHIPEPEDHPGLTKIAKIWRKDKNKELMAEIEDAMLSKGNHLNSDQHAVLSMLLVDLQDWVGLKSKLEAGESPSGVSSREELIDVENPLDQLKEGLSRYNPLAYVKKGIQADIVPIDTTTSLSDQIDEILQEFLEDSPLKEKGIRLMEIEGRGMVFVIGLDMYDDVDEIPEKKIRSLIKSAVNEWEKRNTEE